jgi:argininosuccinate lyase
MAYSHSSHSSHTLMPDTFPAPIYLETVLTHNFEDAQRFFLEDLLEIKIAHTVMLAEAGIIPREDAARIIGALRAIDCERVRAFKYDGSCEDLYFYLENLVVAQVGAETGGKMRVARSRNDVDLTLYRMSMRRRLLTLLEALADLRRAVLGLAAEHRYTVMPAHTHTQPAQPTTLAHYLLAAAEFLARDAARLFAAYENVNRSPMGACAITTTGFPVRRDLTAELLGFDGLVENSYGAIGACDYFTASCAALSVAMINLGRFLQDLLLWSTQEFGYLRLPDAFVQISSIMPQKRNPVALEHGRVLASRAHNEAIAAMQCAHNTPFGDIVDTEDDLQPLTYQAFGNATRVLRLLAGVLPGVQVDVARLRQRAGQSFLTVTELADTLVREAGLPFGKAHEIVHRGVKTAANEEELLQALLAEGLLDEATLRRALDPVNFVAIRGIIGGPAPEETARALEAANGLLAADGGKVSAMREHLALASQRLAAA